MALATLCGKLRNSPKGKQISFTAFIIDHGLRPGSDEEALTVAGYLKQIGAFHYAVYQFSCCSHWTDIPSKIITLDPQQYGDAHATRRIESVARRLRYRALGEECRIRGITNLLFAHHADDQAETTLMRLANNYLGKGLGGMQPEARIPECEDLYGVHNSGTPRNLRHEHAAKSHRVKMLVESGGVTILRPLLGYTKDRLIATCEEASTKWVEDHTNKDRSLTLRNTVRHLHEADLLPAALRRPNLCAIATRTSDRVRQLESQAGAIFNSFDLAFDFRSGHAVCKIAHQKVSEIDAMPERDHIRAILLRKMLSLVASTETMDLPTLESASSIFLQIDGNHGTKQSAPVAVAGATAVRLADSDGAMVYELRRTPPPLNAKEARADIEISLPLQSRAKNDEQVSWTDWKLWDERYWIRVGGPARDNAQPLNVVVRIMTPEDLNSLRQELLPKSDLRLKLSHIKGHLRTTLPVIEQILPDKQKRIVALPSLHWSRHMWFLQGGEQPFKDAHYYDIRYKHIEDGLTVPLAHRPMVNK